MAYVLTLPENKLGRDFVVGDIHGAFTLLGEALLAAKFDTNKDRLIAVGDLIDRGPESSTATLFLEQPWFFAVRGNHEDMFLETCYEDGTLYKRAAYDNAAAHGMKWVFAEPAESLAALRAEIKKLPIALEVQTAHGAIGFLHAEVPIGMDWPTFREKIDSDDQGVIHAALHRRARIKSLDPSGVAGITRVFSGHTPQKNGPQSLGNCYYVDTGAVIRSLKGDLAPEYMLTLCDIRAEALAITGPAANPADEYKIVSAPLKKKQSLKRAGPAR